MRGTDLTLTPSALSTLKTAFARTLAGDIFKGEGDMAALVRSVAQSSPDCRFSTLSEQQCGDRYAVEWEAVGTDTGEVDGRPPTNKPFRVRGCLGRPTRWDREDDGQPRVLP